MLYNLQVLRAIAAMLVVIHHLDKVLGEKTLDPAFYLPSHAGVDLFFVISGFVMTYTTSRRPMRAADFLLNRIIRVVPLYWGFTLFMGGMFLLAPGLFHAYSASPGQILKSLLFVPYLNYAGVMFPVWFVGWTLNYEMAFYALFAIGIAVAGARAQRVAAITATILVAAVLAGVIFRPTAVLPFFYTRSITLEFAMGMGLALVHLRGLTLPRSVAAASVVIGFILLLVAPLVIPMEHRGLSLGLPSLLIVAGALALERHGMVWRNPFLQLIGAGSYALYLVHLLVLMAVSRISGRFDAESIRWLFTVFAFALSIGAAIVVHVVAERPVTAWLRRLVGHKPMEVDRIDPAARLGGRGPA